ncbi:endonuclease III [Sandaracinobacter sp. RS1-74]|uniref:endonuclease III n=1 Tax=Sandaracinobacteroides sayramensis TaxID=2913411 RepID=UPI001EDB7B16|nr:endonuclease III [Sandaracinobacteroides sayramensis]MCG2840490.1 endonuclease III [Sandaracinobacteroides sayramensis]
MREAKRPRSTAKRLPQAEVDAIFDILGAANPDPKTELEFVNPYTLLVAVVLSAQATDVGVNKATRQLFQEVRTPEQMLALGLDGLKRHIRTIGLFNAKAANVIRLSEQLIEKHHGEVPRAEAELVALAGVGRKTANVVRNEAFGEPTLAVDTHVFRVAHRIGLSAGKTPDAVERDLLAQVPARWARAAHHLLILHGRYLCKARTPECWRCPIATLCRFTAKSLQPPAQRLATPGRA